MCTVNVFYIPHEFLICSPYRYSDSRPYVSKRWLQLIAVIWKVTVSVASELVASVFIWFFNALVGLAREVYIFLCVYVCQGLAGGAFLVGNTYSYI